MTVHTHRFSVDTQGDNDMHDVTGEVTAAIRSSGCSDGTVTVFVRHTTAAILVSEFEPGLRADVRLPLERIAPADARYRHNELNADDNAHSHLIGSIISPSLTVPFVDGQLTLGTWQRVVLIELDPHARRRQIVAQIIGE